MINNKPMTEDEYDLEILNARLELAANRLHNNEEDSGVEEDFFTRDNY